MTTFGRAASLRVAYASACQDVVALREENARLQVAVNHEAVQRDMRHKAWLQEKARADAAEAEVARLKAEHTIALEEAWAAVAHHDTVRKEALDALTRLAEEDGDYDVPNIPNIPDDVKQSILDTVSLGDTEFRGLYERDWDHYLRSIFIGPMPSWSEGRTYNIRLELKRRGIYTGPTTHPDRRGRSVPDNEDWRQGQKEAAHGE